VVLTGFATEDNHHSISAWRWGPGGWLYFQEGTFMHSQVETPHGVVRLRYGGVFQFRPRTNRLKVFADYRASNPWGHMFDRWGQSVLIDNPRLYFLAPLTANSRAKLSFEASGKGTKQAGGEFTSGRHLPAKYRGEIWTNQYKAHIVTRYRVEDDGSGFSIQEQEPLIRSSSDSFRPVDLKVGPDGAVYILDWYNPLIGHMQHSFRDSRRDKSHGRVWRVTYKSRPLVKRPDLKERPLPELLDHLKDPEDWTRHQVKRVISVRDPQEVSAALNTWVAALDPNAEQFDHHRLEALWSFQTIDVVNEQLLRAVLKSTDGRARAAAVRVLRYWHDKIANRLELLSVAVVDEYPRVRLEGVLTLGYVPEQRSVVIAMRALDKPTDRFLDHALKLTNDGLQPYWLEAYRAGELKFDSEKHRNFALGNLLSSEAIQSLLAILNSGHIDESQLTGPVAAVAEKANSSQLEPLVLSVAEVTREYATSGKVSISPEALNLILDALDRAARQRGVVPNGNIELLIRRCYSVKNVKTQIATVRLIGAWKLKRETRQLNRMVSSNQPLELRLAAAESLGEVGGRANLATLQRLAGSKTSVTDRYLGTVGLATVDLKSAADVAAKVLHADPHNADPTTVVKSFLHRKGGVDLLASALMKTKPHAEVSKRVMQYINETGEQHPGLVKAFGGTVGSSSLEAELTTEDAKSLAADVKKLGDPVRGEQIFRRNNLACMSCHAIGGAGATLGPDLAAIGSSSPGDYLVDAILRPSKVVKEFYETATVVTAEGKVIHGLLAFKSDDVVVLRDAQHRGKTISIPAAAIDEFIPSKKSLMPTGLANKLQNRQEFLDLARFVTELGRPGPYATSVKPIIRRWRTRNFPGDVSDIDVAALQNALGWQPAYSMVSGLLPLPRDKAGNAVVAVRGEVDVTKTGTIGLKINSTRGLSLWVDEKKVSLSEPIRIDFPTGRRVLTFVIETRKRNNPGLKVELVNVPGSTASYKVVGGL
ncbi:MAG: c-type cytochrome, partial [Planctomycetes bacterium]|nr:c-type cytochrome [Planctomycetota bacterium]